MKPIAKNIPVLFHNETVHKTPSIKQFNAWIQLVIDYCGRFFQVSIEIVSLKVSQELNKTYRQIDKPTNVLSFPMDLPDFVEEDLIGDLVICASVVEQQAHDQNKPIDHHWAHLCIHGCLHLMGYDHIEEDEAEKMENIEIKLLNSLNIKNPYN